MRAVTLGRWWAVLSTSSSSGDILLGVNGVDLTGVTRGEAVANLKNTSSPVVLKVLEMRPPEESVQECMLPPCLTPPPTDSTKSPVPNDDYSPLWVSWLQLPRWAPFSIAISTPDRVCTFLLLFRPYPTPPLFLLTSASWSNWYSDRASWEKMLIILCKLTFQLIYSPLLYQWKLCQRVACEFILLQCVM